MGTYGTKNDSVNDQKGDKIVKAIVLFLGAIFFKKRNALSYGIKKVFEIVSEWEEYGYDIDIYEPRANSAKVLHKINLSILSSLK